MMDLDLLAESVEIVDPQETAHEEWLKRRRGKITGSHFGDLISTGRGNDELFSQTGMAYLRRVAAERFGSFYVTSARSMDWGTEHEASAIDEYRKRQQIEVDSSPFQFFEFSTVIGSTPDGIIDDDGCIEVKCPYDPAVHVNTLLTRKVPKDYEWQVLGHLLCTGRSWCVFISFDPRMLGPERLCVIRVERDKSLIEYLLERLYMAADTVDEVCRKIREYQT